MDLTDIMKQAQSMQTKFNEIQQEVAQKKVEGVSGGGMVKVVVNGRQQIISLTIEPEIYASEDKEMLEDLIIAAANNALEQSKQLLQEELKKLTGGLPMPNFMGNLPL